jgi:hypothetical protein
MRLLEQKDNGDICLTEDIIKDIPAYAILSHTWGKKEEEVTFKDFKEGSGKTKAGYQKIQFCAKQAKRDGLRYFWVDTCCIDQMNSTELSEAIHSMFRWYQEAYRCYVYLTDVPAPSTNPDWETAFSQSRWFTRGWTLQELIAPPKVDFFSHEDENKKLGSKSEMEEHIHQITGITIEALRGDLSKIPVKTRLTWAEKRNTTREEDKAYCLLGILDVSMPLIYGEKGKAWRRLRNEIERMGDSDIGQKSEMSIKEEFEDGDVKGSEEDEKEVNEEGHHEWGQISSCK